MTTTEKFHPGYGRMRRKIEREGRYRKALLWLTFRFDEAAADKWAREQSIKDQLAATGGVDPAQFPPTSPIAYLKFSDL